MLYYMQLMDSVKSGYSIQYTAFLELFGKVMVVQFIFILLFVPALTAGSISAERERKTLDLMLMTLMTPKDIVLGNLMTAFCTAGFYVCSSLPILSMVFMYGGILWSDLLGILVAFFVGIFFTSSICIFISSICEKITSSMVLGYACILTLVFATYYLSVLDSNGAVLNALHFGISENIQYHQSPILTLCNPLASFFASVQMITGESKQIGGILQEMGSHHLLFHRWFLMSMVSQMLLGLSCLVLTVKAMKNRFTLSDIIFMEKE